MFPAIAIVKAGMCMKGKFAVVLLIATLSTPCPFQRVSAEQPAAREWRAEVALDVDQAGQVVAVELPDTIPDVLATSAREVISRWRFKPVLVDGHAVSARTYARVKVQVVKRDAGTFGVQVVYSSNGPRVKPSVAPYYPLRETNHGEGSLLMEATVKPDGRIEDIKVVESHFSGPRKGLFSRSAEQAVKQWQADPEYVDGHPVATRIQLPMKFCLGRDGGCKERVQPLKLLRHAETDLALSSQPLGEAVALDSPLQPSAISADGQPLSTGN